MAALYIQVEAYIINQEDRLKKLWKCICSTIFIHLAIKVDELEKVSELANLCADTQEFTRLLTMSAKAD
jgi:hypothetical protein